MELFSFFKKNKDKDNNTNKKYSYLEMMKGTTPSYSSFGDNVMQDETVSSVTQRLLNEYMKLNPQHIRTVDGKQVPLSDNHINTLLKFPNKFETIADFLSKAAYVREDLDNVFMYPSYDLYINNKTGQSKKIYRDIRILRPINVSFYEDDSGTYFVEFTFKDGVKSGKLPYDDIIHWRKNYGESEIMGGGTNGLPNNSALLKHLVINDKLLQSTVKSINSSLTINGILKLAGTLSKEKQESARIKFEEQLKNNESGIMTVDSGGEYINVKSDGKIIDAETLKFMDAKILRHYGVSEAIFNGDYKPEQKEAFYETVLESSIISLGLAFSRVMLTPFERANGNEIIFYTHKIQMMSHDKKISLANLLMPVGGVTPNQILSWFGEPPYEGGDERYVSLNWIKKEIADDYQLEKYKYGTLNKEPKKDSNNPNDNAYNSDDSDNNGDEANE